MAEVENEAYSLIKDLAALAVGSNWINIRLKHHLFDNSYFIRLYPFDIRVHSSFFYLIPC